MLIHIYNSHTYTNAHKTHRVLKDGLCCTHPMVRWLGQCKFMCIALHYMVYLGQLQYTLHGVCVYVCSLCGVYVVVVIVVVVGIIVAAGGGGYCMQWYCVCVCVCVSCDHPDLACVIEICALYIPLCTPSTHTHTQPTHTRPPTMAPVHLTPSPHPHPQNTPTQHQHTQHRHTPPVTPTPHIQWSMGTMYCLY